MSFNFTVQKVEGFQPIAEGIYRAQVDHMEYVHSDFGNYTIVNWKVITPSEFEGRVHQERFNIEHENDKVRHIAIQNFSKFCVEVGGLKEGDDPTQDDFLFKIADITIRNKTAKDGKVYTNVIRRELVGGDTKKETERAILNEHASIAGIAGSGMVPLQASGTPVDLNDGVPF